MRMSFVILLTCLLVFTLIFGGCAKTASTTTTTAATATTAILATTTAAPVPTPSTATAVTAAKTLKIGMLANFAWGDSAVKCLEILSELDNKKGGLNIGGEKYNIKFVCYDTQGSQDKGTAALNRLIYEDNVKFVMTYFDPIDDAFLPITESNKVILMNDTVTPPILSPNNHYSFNAGQLNTLALCVFAWVAKTYPDKNYYLGLLPDNQMGHVAGADLQSKLEFFGKKCTLEFYPASSTDLSAIGTKVKSLNPDICVVMGGGPPVDSVAMKAIWNAGFRGPIVDPPPVTAIQFQALVPPGALDEFINTATDMEFDPTLSQASQEFKDAWIAKYGKYEGESTGMATWDCLRTALPQAGSLNTDKVAAVIDNGLKFSGPAGTYQMVSRADQGNNRTIDSVWQMNIKTIKDGKPVLLGTMNLDEVIAAHQSFYK